MSPKVVKIVMAEDVVVTAVDVEVIVEVIVVDTEADMIEEMIEVTEEVTMTDEEVEEEVSKTDEEEEVMTMVVVEEEGEEVDMIVGMIVGKTILAATLILADAIEEIQTDDLPQKMISESLPQKKPRLDPGLNCCHEQ